MHDNSAEAIRAIFVLISPNPAANKKIHGEFDHAPNDREDKPLLVSLQFFDPFGVCL